MLCAINEHSEVPLPLALQPGLSQYREWERCCHFWRIMYQMSLSVTVDAHLSFINHSSSSEMYKLRASRLMTGLGLAMLTKTLTKCWLSMHK